MAGKDLYYDKYLKYKNKYLNLNLKNQIGGNWVVNSDNNTYTASITDKDIQYKISLEYKINNYKEHSLSISINSNNGINIIFILNYYPDNTGEIKNRSLEGIELFKKNIQLKERFKLAINHIKQKIKLFNVKKFIIDNINERNLLNEQLEY
jgi:hypothetical protein